MITITLIIQFPATVDIKQNVLNNKCLTKIIIYKVTVTNNINIGEKNHIGDAEKKSIKARYYNYKLSFDKICK